MTEPNPNPDQEPRLASHFIIERSVLIIESETQRLAIHRTEENSGILDELAVVIAPAEPGQPRNDDTARLDWLEKFKNHLGFDKHGPKLFCGAMHDEQSIRAAIDQAMKGAA